MSEYADSGCLVSLYVRDALAPEVVPLLAGNAGLALLPLHRSEFANALALRLFRREMTPAEVAAAARLFREHQARGVYRQLAWPAEAWELSEQLSARFVARLGVRTLDVLHVAAALTLEAAAFYSFDTRQRALARAAGLRLRPGGLRRG
ncbi:MAG: PIN domain-containing protein [Terriglobales bacterium]